MFTDEQIKRLQAPLDGNRVKHRKGDGGKMLAYLEGHDVISTANDIFGFGNWSTGEYQVLATKEHTTDKNGRKRFDVHVVVQGTITVRNADRVVTYSDVGYGSGQSYSDHGTAMELAYKEACTDALKRCFRHFGNQFGNSLYGGTLGEQPVSFDELTATIRALGVTPEQVRALAGKPRDELTQAEVDELVVKLRQTYGGDAA